MSRQLGKGIHEEYADKAEQTVEVLDHGLEDVVAVLEG